MFAGSDSTILLCNQNSPEETRKVSRVLHVWLPGLMFLILFSQLETRAKADQTVRVLTFAEDGKASSTHAGAAAVVVRDTELLYTSQMFPQKDSANLTEMSAEQQFENVLSQLIAAASPDTAPSESSLVKLNLYVTSDEIAGRIRKSLSEKFSVSSAPAVSFVVSRLPVPDAVLAADAVFAVNPQSAESKRSRTSAILPVGRRIFISGQAEQSASLAEATTKTLKSLSDTLQFLGRSDGDIVQLKAFVQPMSDAGVVEAEIEKFYPDGPPPLVLVEWKSSQTTPIEIELVASGGDYQNGEPSMEFLTPPGMTASPVYCRVCRTNHPSLIFLSGLYSDHDRQKNPTTAENGEIEVSSVFATMKKILDTVRSDYRHLAKATYYVSTDSASLSLNKLRPGYYDPARPPAASKALVDSVASEGLGLTIDMIAVPAD